MFVVHFPRGGIGIFSSFQLGESVVDVVLFSWALVTPSPPLLSLFCMVITGAYLFLRLSLSLSSRTSKGRSTPASPSPAGGGDGGRRRRRRRRSSPGGGGPRCRHRRPRPRRGESTAGAPPPPPSGGGGGGTPPLPKLRFLRVPPSAPPRTSSASASGAGCRTTRGPAQFRKRRPVETTTPLKVFQRIQLTTFFLRSSFSAMAAIFSPLGLGWTAK